MANQNRIDGDTAPDRPAEPFKPLGNETRLEILRVLYEHVQTSSRAATLSYSTLRDEVGVQDKGNFNYHLRQLDGRFVESGGDGDDGDGDDGYRLTFAGFEIAKVIDVDAWQSHESCGPVVLDGEGTESDEDDGGCENGNKDSIDEDSIDEDRRDNDDETEPMTAVYEDSVVEIRRDENPLYAHAVRPTGAAARGMELEALLDVASTLWRHTIEQILDGICPYCHAPTDRTLDRTEDGHWTHTFSAACGECGPLGGSHVGIVALPHPATVSFFWDHDRELTDYRVWDVPFVDDEAVTVVNEEPARLRVDVELDGDRLSVFVDDSVRVVETDRRDRQRHTSSTS